MKHQPEGRRHRRPGSAQWGQPAANPLTDGGEQRPSVGIYFPKALLRHWEGCDENPVSAICELKALLGNWTGS